MSQEIAVAISDALLAVWTGALALMTVRNQNEFPAIRKWFSFALGFAALGALLGGLWHGFFSSYSSFLGTALWRMTMLSVGAAAFGLLQISVLLFGSEVQRRRAGRFGLASYMVYAAFVLLYSDEFVLAMAYYVPITFLLLLGFAVRRRERFAKFGLLYVGLSLAAALIQHFQIGLHPVYCNHNVLYHVVQGVANYFLFLAGRAWRGSSSVAST